SFLATRPGQSSSLSSRTWTSVVYLVRGEGLQEDGFLFFFLHDPLVDAQHRALPAIGCHNPRIPFVVLLVPPQLPAACHGATNDFADVGQHRREDLGRQHALWSEATYRDIHRAEARFTEVEDVGIKIQETRQRAQ